MMFINFHVLIGICVTSLVGNDVHYFSCTYWPLYTFFGKVFVQIFYSFFSCCLLADELEEFLKINSGYKFIFLSYASVFSKYFTKLSILHPCQ